MSLRNKLGEDAVQSVPLSLRPALRERIRHAYERGSVSQPSAEHVALAQFAARLRALLADVDAALDRASFSEAPKGGADRAAGAD